MARPKATVLPEPVWAETIEVAALGLGFEDGGLDGGGRFIAARGEGFAEKRRQGFECHIRSKWGARPASQG